MDLTSQKNIKALLRRYKAYPSKRLGQNFLIDKKVLNKIIKTANLQKKDIILEIGPGIGNLTQELAKRVKKVIAVEKDKRMCEILKETLKDFKNVEIINKDILRLNFQFSIFPEGKPLASYGAGNFQSISNFQFSKKYKVVANLPYYITSSVIRKFLESPNPPKEMVLMVQKEVAQRICARPPKMTLLAVSVQFYSTPEIIDYVSKESFWPQPKVDAAILRIAPRINADRKRIDADLFFKVVKAGFSHPRKQLANNLSKELKLDKKEFSSLLLKNNIKPTQRAETLTIRDWLNLTHMLK